MSDYYTLLTNAGIAHENACKAAGVPIKLTQISVGDGNGAVYNPAATATALKREVWRGPLNALFQDDKNPSWLLAEVTIPPEVGGFYVREAGIWTDTGILYAIVKYPESFKPVLATSGSGKEFYIRAIFETSNASQVTLMIDDTIVKATRAWVISYVADELAKLDGKQSVRAATTANISRFGAQQIDGVAVVAGDRVLVANQSAAKDNGIYVVTNGLWERAVDADSGLDVTPGLFVSVEVGTVNGDSVWQLVTDAPIVLGVTPLVFEMMVGRTGVSAGAYRVVTVDKYGRVIGGTNPTTLASNGITDGLTSTPQSGVVGAIADIPVTTLGTYIPATTDKPPTSSNGLFLRMKWPGGNTAFDIFGHIGGGGDILAFRRVLGDGSYVMRHVYHDGNFNPALKANLDSPALTGVPTAPTAPPGSNYGEVANCAFVSAAINTYATTVTASLATKAPLNSPALTGIPTVPTAAPGTNSLQAANTAFVAAAIAKLVDSSPGALDTLNELARALGNDPNFATTMVNELAKKAEHATTLAGYGITDAYRVVDVDYRLNGKANKANSLAGYGIGDAIRNNNPLPGESIDIHGGTYAFLSSPLESTVAQNCYWDGVDWVRHDGTKGAVCISAANGVAQVRTALPGAGPIRWATSDLLWTSSNATVSSSNGTGTLKLPNGWIQQVFDVTESLHAGDVRYFPVSFPNECLGVFPSLTSATAGSYANNSGLCVGDVNKDRFVISAGGNFSPEGRFRVLAIGR
jgi:phage-related tail fiber protein